MGKRKLYAGVIVGAIIGGLVTLRSTEVRAYTSNKCAAATSQIKYKFKNPASSIRKIRLDLIKCRHHIDQGAGQTIQALEQIEQTLDKVIQKK